jgi:hypothetical protein
MKKAELLQWLQDEQQQWNALLAQIDPAQMDQPGVVGQWSIKDLVAHLNGWQTRLISHLRAAHQGEPEPSSPWPAHLQEEDAINAWIYETNRNRTVNAVLAENAAQFQQLVAVIEGLPEAVQIKSDYRVIEFGDKRFSASEFFDHFHDDHEPDVRAWLAEQNS